MQEEGIARQIKLWGPDGIRARILKVCAINLAYPLSLLFDLSYRSGSIPSDWKNTNVVPVFKKDRHVKYINIIIAQFDNYENIKHELSNFGFKHIT